MSFHCLSASLLGIASFLLALTPIAAAGQTCFACAPTPTTCRFRMSKGKVSRTSLPS